MTVYIDSEFKCHTSAGEGLTAFESDFFDGKCDAFIEGYRAIPEGESWIRDDGEVFTEGMIAPWKDYNILAAYQEQYEVMNAELMAMQMENEDMKTALAILEVNEQ